jgi:hypothetical protein
LREKAMASSFPDPSWPGGRVAACLGSWLLIREPAAHQCRPTGCSDLATLVVATLAVAARLWIDWTAHQTQPPEGVREELERGPNAVQHLPRVPATVFNCRHYSMHDKHSLAYSVIA